MSVAAKIGNFFYNTENFYPDHINKNILVTPISLEPDQGSSIRILLYTKRAKPTVVSLGSLVL